MQNNSYQDAYVRIINILSATDTCDLEAGIAIRRGLTIIVSLFEALFTGVPFEEALKSLIVKHKVYKSEIMLYFDSFVNGGISNLYDAMHLPLEEKQRCLWYFINYLTETEKAMLDPPKTGTVGQQKNLEPTVSPDANCPEKESSTSPPNGNELTFNRDVLYMESAIAGPNALLSKIIALVTNNPTNNGEKWTAMTVAQKLGVTSFQVTSAVSDSSLSFERNTCWKYLTTEKSYGTSMELVSMYLTENDKVLIFQKVTDEHPAEGYGLYSTQNRHLAKEMDVYASLSNTISLESALTNATRHSTDEGQKKKYSLHKYWDSIYPAISTSENAQFLMLYHGKQTRLTFSYTKLNMKLIMCDSEEKWITDAAEVIPSAEGLKLLSIIEEYNRHSHDAKEPFLWFRKLGEEKPNHYGTNTGDDSDLPPMNSECDNDPSPSPAGKRYKIQFTGPNNELVEHSFETPDLLENQCENPTSIQDILIYATALESIVKDSLDKFGCEMYSCFINNTLSKGMDENNLIPKEVEMETLMGRIPVNVYGDEAKKLGPRERLKTHSFTALECYTCSKIGYENAGIFMNLMSRRSQNSFISWSTEYDDVVRKGEQYRKLLDNEYLSILKEYGVTVNDAGEIIDHSAADSLTRGASVCGNGSKTVSSVEEQENADGVNQDPLVTPHVKNYIVSPCVLPDYSDPVQKYISNYNYYRPDIAIQGDFFIETDPENTIYICTDDVLVLKQPHTRKGKTPDENKEREKWIYHSVAHISVPNVGVYTVDAESQKKLYSIIYAFLIKNGYAGRFLLFFSDGEETLKSHMEDIFSEWPHRMIGDFWHMAKHISDLCSMTFSAGKVPDPLVEPERFKNGKVKKKSVKMITRSRLFAREINRYIWSGNPDLAIALLRKFDKNSKEIKSPYYKYELISYLERKQDRMTPFVVRRRFRLPNSSNRVENANNILVAMRQKKKGMSWCDMGSFGLSGITSVIKNMDSQEFFCYGRISFSPRPMAAGRSPMEEIGWILKSCYEPNYLVNLQ